MTLTPDEIRQMRRDMSSTVFDFTCVIERNNGVSDGYGHITPDWDVHLTNQICHFWLKKEEEIEGPAINIVLGDSGLLVPNGIDVTEQDRITTITNQLNEVIGTVYRILSVKERASHLELDLKAENA
jgi:hypothetical protein